MGTYSNDSISGCFSLGWTERLYRGEHCSILLLQDKNLVAGILEMKLQFLLSELGINIDIPFKIKDRYLQHALNCAWHPSSQRSLEIKSTNFCWDEGREVTQKHKVEDLVTDLLLSFSIVL